MTDAQNLSLAEFVPAKEQLLQLKDEARKIDLGNFDQVHLMRIRLRDARVALSKTGKSLRDGALLFQKAVIAKEKDLIDIILEDEKKLSTIEEEMKAKAEAEKRRAELPSRRAALSAVGDLIEAEPSDDFLLGMDEDQFNAYRLDRIDKKLQHDREELDKQKLEEETKARERQAEEDRIRREKLEADEKAAKEREAAHRAKVAEEEKAIAAEKAKVEAEKARLAGIEEQRLREEEARKAKAEADRAEAEAKRAADAAAFREKKFNAWLEEVGYDADKDNVKRLDTGEVQVWRLVATYRPENV